MTGWTFDRGADDRVALDLGGRCPSGRLTGADDRGALDRGVHYLRSSVMTLTALRWVELTVINTGNYQRDECLLTVFRVVDVISDLF